MRKMLRNLLFAAVMVLACAGRLALGTKLAVFGAVPELMPALAAAAGVIAGKTAGAWCGFLGGLLCDLATPYGMGVRAPVFFLAGAFAGELTRRSLKAGFPAAFLFTAAAAVLSQAADVLIEAARGLPYAELLRDALLRTLYACALAPAAWLLLRGITKVLRVPEDRGVYRKPSRISGLRSVRHPEEEEETA